MIEPRRKENAKKFLDASLVPLENALKERARQLKTVTSINNEAAQVRLSLATEFERLAEELHHW